MNKTNNEMDDETLIGYALSHSETEVALFHVDHVRRLLVLAGREIPDDLVRYPKQFYSIDRYTMRPLVEEIRARQEAAKPPTRTVECWNVGRASGDVVQVEITRSDRDSEPTWHGFARTDSGQELRWRYHSQGATLLAIVQHFNDPDNPVLSVRQDTSRIEPVT